MSPKSTTTRPILRAAATAFAASGVRQVPVFQVGDFYAEERLFRAVPKGGAVGGGAAFGGELNRLQAGCYLTAD